MFKKLFKKNQNIEFLMPITGTVMPITEAPDEVFSGKMMGDGFCILPAEGKVYSPVSGKVISIFPTKHCIGLVDDKGNEWLIHFGMDTVNLNGEGFELKVEANQTVEAGQLMLEVDIAGIKDKIPSLVTPVVLTNLSDQSIKVQFAGKVDCKDKYVIEVI